VPKSADHGRRRALRANAVELADRLAGRGARDPHRQRLLRRRSRARPRLPHWPAVLFQPMQWQRSHQLCGRLVTQRTPCAPALCRQGQGAAVCALPEEPDVDCRADEPASSFCVGNNLIQCSGAYRVSEKQCLDLKVVVGVVVTLDSCWFRLIFRERPRRASKGERRLAFLSARWRQRCAATGRASGVRPASRGAVRAWLGPSDG